MYFYSLHTNTWTYTHNSHNLITITFLVDVSLSKTICLAQRNEHKTNTHKKNTIKFRTLIEIIVCACGYSLLTFFPAIRSKLFLDQRKKKRPATKYCNQSTKSVCFWRKKVRWFSIYVGFHSSVIELYGSVVGTCEFKCVNECLSLSLSLFHCLFPNVHSDQ